MVDLARQAFSTNNFNLAAEIFERTIKENGPKSELYLGLGDSCAKGGQFSKAFQAYAHAFRLGRVSSEKLKHLVTALIECVKQEESDDGMKKKCMFTCWICRGLFSDPVTIPCGHTFCRKCLAKDPTKSCKICGVVHYRLKLSAVKSNVALCGLVEKWFVDECEGNKLKQEGNKFFEVSDYQKAIHYWSKALDLVPKDHLLLSNRSYAYLRLDHTKEALCDADLVVQLRPDWPKGYFRRGSALLSLDQNEDAVVAFLQCLALDPSVTQARDQLSRSLHKILSQPSPDDPKLLLHQQHNNPSILQQLISTNFNTSKLFPDLSVSTIIDLKHIISETLATASNFSPAVATIPQPLSSLADIDSESDGQDDTEQHTTLRCRSAPSSRDASPIPGDSNGLGAMAPISLPDVRVSRKRSRKPSGAACCPTSPTRSSAVKYMRPEEVSAAATSKIHDVRPIPSELLSVDDFECGLCYRLFYNPVTTPCGHSFCRQCLDRCLDHTTNCPLCKSSLVEYLAERRQAVTEALQTILEVYFPKANEERLKAHEDEMLELARMGSDRQHEIPVFVCTLSFPFMHCPLHVFEPRYRLMIRQCMESGTRQFGMCVAFSEDEDNFSDIGTMLEVRDVQFFPDGRSLVDTIGGRRFKVLERGHRDGYNTAKIEYLTDTKVEGEQLTELLKVEEEVFGVCQQWFENLSSTHQVRITQHFGPIPAREPDPQTGPNGPKWHWWVVAILPLDPRVQLALLTMVSYKERLLAIKKVLSYLKKRSGR